MITTAPAGIARGSPRRGSVIAYAPRMMMVSVMTLHPFNRHAYRRRASNCDRRSRRIAFARSNNERNDTSEGRKAVSLTVRPATVSWASPSRDAMLSLSKVISGRPFLRSWPPRLAQTRK